MKALLWLVVMLVSSVASADSTLHRVLVADPSQGRNVHGHTRSLAVRFEVEHSRSDAGWEFHIVASNKDGVWPHAVWAYLAEVRYDSGEGGPRGWHVQRRDRVVEQTLTDSTAVYVVAVSDSVAEHLSFVFVQTYEMPSLDMYEIKLSEWVERRRHRGRRGVKK